MVILSIECTSEYGEYDDLMAETVEYGTNEFYFYQEDDPGCKVWFDRENSNEPTTKAKSWLSQRGHPETKAALCSAKAPIKGSDWETMQMYKTFPLLNKTWDEETLSFVEEKIETKKVCMTICDFCPNDANRNQTIETNEPSPIPGRTTTEKVNQGTKEFSISLHYLYHNIYLQVFMKLTFFIP